MRILSLIAVVVFLSALVPQARAGTLEDCVREQNPNPQIGDCTAAIRSGEYSGRQLAVAYTNRGFAYSNHGEYRRAIEDYDEALRIDPRHALAYNNRGNAYSYLGEYRRAIEDYDQALRHDPGHAWTHNNRAWALYLLGRNAQALDDVEQSLSLGHGDANAFDTRAHVLAALGRTRAALASFERAMRFGRAGRVRAYQEALAKHGFYRGAVDGAYGPETRAALVACLNAGCRVIE
jgi:tetratricopeptide (TPR) repeat protein